MHYGRDATNVILQAGLMALSRSQIDKLGDRLRQGDDLSEADRAGYVAYRASFDQALAEVQSRIADELGLAVVSRLKTLETVVLKLKRQSIRLSQIGDIAGCRIVVETLPEQDDVVQRLKELFPDSRLNDYRERPQWGYRAVHLIVVTSAAGSAVEVQVRTHLQNLWANASEALA